MNVVPLLVLAIALSGIAGCAPGTPAPAPTGPSEEAIAPAPSTEAHTPPALTGTNGNALVYSDSSTRPSGLQGVRYVGAVGEGHGALSLLLADRNVDGLTERALFVLNSTDTVAPAPDRAHSWNAPGRKLDGETGEPFLTVQVYYGTVLPDTTGVIWYEEALMPNGDLRQNTTLLHCGPAGLDTLVFFGKGRLAVTNTLAYRGQCRELRGTDQRQAP